jgi:hypothetical protein
MDGLDDGDVMEAESKESNYVCLTPDDIVREQQDEIQKVAELFEVRALILILTGYYIEFLGFILFPIFCKFLLLLIRRFKYSSSVTEYLIVLLDYLGLNLSTIFQF